MRLAPALLALAALTAVPAAASKPPGASENPRRAMFRLQTFGACMSANQPHEQYDPEDRFRMPDCECAADRYMGDRDLSELRLVEPGEKGAFDALLATCRAERRARAGQPAVAPTPPADAPIADDTPAAGPTDSPAVDGRKARSVNPAAWLARTGIPLWGWAAIVALALGLLSMMRRQRRANDLMSPPRSMRHEAVPPPPPPIS